MHGVDSLPDVTAEASKAFHYACKPVALASSSMVKAKIAGL